MSWVTACTRASARSGEWDGPRSADQVHIWSSRAGKRPTWWTRPPYQGTGQALLVEGGDGFGPDVLALSRPHALDGKGAFDCVLDGGLGHLASGVVLHNNHGGAELVVQVDDSQRPAIRGESGGLVGEYVCVLAAHVCSDDDDAGLRACGLGGHGGDMFKMPDSPSIMMDCASGRVRATRAMRVAWRSSTPYRSTGQALSADPLSTCACLAEASAGEDEPGVPVA